jgi:hypothetical protein
MEASHGPHTTDPGAPGQRPERGVAVGTRGPEGGGGHGAAVRTAVPARTVSQAVAAGPAGRDTRAAGLAAGTAGAPRGAVEPAAAPAAPGAEAGQDACGPGACDVVTVPARQGLEAVDILRRGGGGDRPAVGPVLHDGSCATLGFLVPPGTAAAWDVPGSACTRTNGHGLRLPTEPPVLGSGWLLPPEMADPVTDPSRLRAALGEAARLIEAADSHR